MKTFISIATMAVIMALTVAESPFVWLDAKVREKGEDPEAGLTTLEYVILSAVVLAVVVAVAAVITGRMNAWAEKIPGG